MGALIDALGAEAAVWQDNKSDITDQERSGQAGEIFLWKDVRRRKGREVLLRLRIPRPGRTPVNGHGWAKPLHVGVRMVECPLQRGLTDGRQIRRLSLPRCQQPSQS